MSDQADRAFDGAIPDIYDRLFVPLIFEPFARDVVERVAPAVARVAGGRSVTNVLEIAAGTGVVTRALCARLPDSVDITATDLNPAMLDRAAAHGTTRPVRWQQADAMDLPFPDGSFDVVVCQFGVMFFPDRRHAFAEMGRVVRPGGTVIVSSWDGLDSNDFARVVVASMAERYPHDPPDFLTRIPHGYHDPDVIVADARSVGSRGEVELATVTATSTASSAQPVATAYCHGTPMRHEILAREPAGLDGATADVAAALADAFGPRDLAGAITAHVVTVTTPSG